MFILRALVSILNSFDETFPFTSQIKIKWGFDSTPPTWNRETVFLVEAILVKDIVATTVAYNDAKKSVER